MRLIFEILLVAVVVGAVVTFAGERFGSDAISQRVMKEWSALRGSLPAPDEAEGHAATVAEQPGQRAPAESVIAESVTSVNWVVEPERSEDPGFLESTGAPREISADAIPAAKEAYLPTLQPLEHGEVTEVLKRLGRVSRMAAHGQAHPDRARMAITGATLASP